MYFADEIRDDDGILPDRKRAVDKRELKLAIDLIERMQGSFDHSAYHDRYRDRLMAIIDKKRKGETITAPEVEERKAPADLMEALEASLGEAVGRSKARKAPAAARSAQEKKAARKRSPRRPSPGRPRGRRPPSRPARDRSFSAGTDGRDRASSPGAWLSISRSTGPSATPARRPSR